MKTNLMDSQWNQLTLKYAVAFFPATKVKSLKYSGVSSQIYINHTQTRDLALGGIAPPLNSEP